MQFRKENKKEKKMVKINPNDLSGPEAKNTIPETKDKINKKLIDKAKY